MNLDEAKENIGQMVMAADSMKLIKGPHKPHGPYLLIRVTKGGMCELERDENRHGTRFVKPTLISLPNAVITDSYRQSDSQPTQDEQR